MRCQLLPGLCALLLVPAGIRADDRAEGIKLVDQAIKAMGGEGKVAGYKLILMKGKGTIKEGGKEIQVTGELTSRGAAHHRMDLEGNLDGMQMKITLVMNPDEGWAKVMDRVEPAPKEQYPSIKQAFYTARTAQMLDSLKEKDVKLAPLGEVQVAGKAALGLKVTRPERGDLDIYFDKETYLPVKCETRFKGPRDQEGNFEYLFSDYKESGGLKHFGKLVIKFEGTALIEMEVAEVKVLEKVEDGTFAKPE